MSARIPSATYRLQLNRDFTLRDAAGIVDYLDRLGVTDCYTSPVSQARSGSRHGYDVIDHRRLNPEIGGADGFREFAAKLRQYAMGVVVDTVPNHMCIADPSNQWWWDVLENGPSSPFASFFDIDWNPPKADLHNKVLLPMLGDQYRPGAGERRDQDRVSKTGDFRPATTTGCCRSRRAPGPGSCEPALDTPGARAGRVEPRVHGAGEHHHRAQASAAAHRNRPCEGSGAPARKGGHQGAAGGVGRKIRPLRSAIDASIADLNGIKGDPHSFDRLEALLADQAYRLSFWHVAADEINYRRFFDVNELAAIRVEDPAVFEAVHELTLRPDSSKAWSPACGSITPTACSIRGRYLRTLQSDALPRSALAKRPASRTTGTARRAILRRARFLLYRGRKDSDGPTSGCIRTGRSMARPATSS